MEVAIGSSCVPRLGDRPKQSSSRGGGSSACFEELFSFDPFNIVNGREFAVNSTQGSGSGLVASASPSTLALVSLVSGILAETPRGEFDAEASESVLFTSGTASFSAGL